MKQKKHSPQGNFCHSSRWSTNSHLARVFIHHHMIAQTGVRHLLTRLAWPGLAWPAVAETTTPALVCHLYTLLLMTLNERRGCFLLGCIYGEGKPFSTESGSESGSPSPPGAVGQCPVKRHRKDILAVPHFSPVRKPFIHGMPSTPGENDFMGRAEKQINTDVGFFDDWGETEDRRLFRSNDRPIKSAL